MPAETLAAPPSTAPAAPAPASAPTSAPETYAPAVTESAAPVTQTPETSAPAELNPQDFETPLEFAQAVVEQRTKAKQDAATIETPEEKPASETEAAQRPEEIAPDGEQPPAEAKPAEETPAGPELDIEDVLTPKALNDKLAANPELKAALDKDGALKGEIFKNARLASEAAQYKEIFPDVESAKYAMENAATFRELDSLFMGSETPETAGQFVGKLAEMSMLRDEQGNPVLQNGVPQLHPAFNGFLEHMKERQLDFIRKTAEKNGDHELLAAVDVIRERTSASSQPTEELPQHLKQAAENIKRREAELNRQQLEQQTAAAQAFDQSVGQEAQTKIDAMINPILEKAALPAFVRQTAREKIDAAIMETLGKNRFFQARMAELSRYPMTAETKQQRVNLIMSHVQSLAGNIVRQVLKDASAPVIQKQQERQDKIQTQTDRSRSEPRSTAGPAISPKPQSPEAQFQSIRDSYIAEHGEEPSAQHMIELWAKARQNGAAR